MQHHPEQTPDQIFIGNEPRENRLFRDSFCSWKSKTYGKTAYDINNRIIENMVPVFINVSEVESAIEHQKFLLENSPETAYGAEDNIRVWQEMLNKRTVF